MYVPSSYIPYQLDFLELDFFNSGSFDAPLPNSMSSSSSSFDLDSLLLLAAAAETALPNCDERSEWRESWR